MKLLRCSPTRQSREALAKATKALKLQPGNVVALNIAGACSHRLGKLKDAEVYWRRALKEAPDYADAHNNLGILLNQTKRFAEAEAAWRRALKLRPDHADACYHLGELLLQTGRFSEGWPLHEARYHEDMPERVVRPALAYPQWQGESLENKSILVHCEPGFGDQIQFVRYLASLKEMGASLVTLICPAPLQPLFEHIAGADVVLTTDEVVKAPPHDYWTFLLSLPLHLGTTLDSIPATIPYLTAAADRLDAWSPRLPPAERLRVGLVWAGNAAQNNDANRSLPGLAALAPLWDIPGIHFVSLQKGQTEGDAATPQSRQLLTHLGGDIKDFADSAAIVAQLDLVICVDTAIAHLAGALGKPCWILLPSVNAAWRWLDERTDSPWYPGAIRLFRQRHLHDWAPTILEVAQSLRDFCQDRQHD